MIRFVHFLNCLLISKRKNILGKKRNWKPRLTLVFYLIWQRTLIYLWHISLIFSSFFQKLWSMILMICSLILGLVLAYFSTARPFKIQAHKLICSRISDPILHFLGFFHLINRIMKLRRYILNRKLLKQEHNFSHGIWDLLRDKHGD